MMKKLGFVALIMISTSLQAQVLRTLNFRYLYNPDEVVTLNWNVVKENTGYRIFYTAHLNDTSRFKLLTIHFETRKSVAEKTGEIIVGNQEIQNDSRLHKSGSQSFVPNAGETIVVAKVMANDPRKTSLQYFFYKNLSSVATSYGIANNQPISSLYINKNQATTFAGFDSNKQLILSYYKNSFPAAAPSFSTAQARVAKVVKPDSIFQSSPTDAVTLSQKGLYLIQQDTASAQGVAFRVEDDYPKLGTLETLVGPLIYICTKQEYEKLQAAGNDKKKFDQLILSITGNTERARIFMRNYFKRVEQANQYFSSYKEGWKTDRGMMYIIYGIPDEVYLFDDREIWEYKNEYVRNRFHFIKSSTVFDPENFVLIREKKFTDDWYSMIDLWRKARF